MTSRSTSAERVGSAVSRTRASSSKKNKQQGSHPRPVSTGYTRRGAKLNRQRSHRGKNKNANKKDQEETEDKPRPDLSRPEEKLKQQLLEFLRDVSRQRLRAVEMSFRHYSNVDSKISQKDLNQAFQDNHVKISNRVFQQLIETFDDQKGLSHERIYQFLVDAQAATGRDSVCEDHRGDPVATKKYLTPSQRDADLIRRLEEMLVKQQEYFDIDTLRSKFQLHDTSKNGRMDRTSVLMVCDDASLPLYGALQKSLLRRCDDENNDVISWPEFLNFLEKSQNLARKKCPSLLEVPEKKKKEKVVPFVETTTKKETSGAANPFLGRFLKKASKKREGTSSPLNLSADSTNMPIMDQENAGTKSPLLTPRKDNPESKQLDSITDTNAKEKNITETDSKATPLIKLEREGTPQHSSESNSDSKDTANAVSPQIAQSPQDNGQNENNNNDKDTKEDLKKNEIKPEKKRELHIAKPAYFKDKNISTDPPVERLQLDWVYGYRGNDCRKNIHIIASGEIAYFIANITVLYSTDDHVQRHYKEHTEDIKCMALHSNGIVVATGQFASRHSEGPKAHIRVWRSDTLTTLHVLDSNMFAKSVMCLAFYKAQDVLLAIDNNKEKTLSAWNTSTGDLIASTVVNTDVICDIDFNKKFDNSFITTGKEHIQWWKVYPEENLIQKLSKPDYETFLRAKYIICAIHNEKGDLLTGDSNGTIYVWGNGNNKITNFVKHAHDGPVFTLLIYRNYLLSGGRDGIVHSWKWGKNMENSGMLQIPREEGGVRMLHVHEEKLLIGTTVNSILVATLNDKGIAPLEGSVLLLPAVTQGHFDDLRGIYSLTQTKWIGDIMTTGIDGNICSFSTDTHQPVWKAVHRGHRFLSLDCKETNDQITIVLGTRDGYIHIFEVKGEFAIEVVHVQKVASDRINAVRFSTDGNYIAAGSQSGVIYLWHLELVEEGGESFYKWILKNKVQGHYGSTTSLDWSETKYGESYLLKSCSAALERVVWRCPSLDKLQDGNIKELTWKTHQCKIDYNISGVWESYPTVDAEITAVDVNKTGNLLAIGDNRGYLKLYRNPCCKPESFCHSYKAHQVVYGVRFSPDGHYVLTIGGKDSCVLQWKLV